MSGGKERSDVTMVKQNMNGEIWERQYGGYHVQICFAKEDTPNADQRLLDAIMQGYRHRIERCIERE